MTTVYYSPSPFKKNQKDEKNVFFKTKKEMLR